MISRKQIPEGRTCNHITCGSVCRREAPAKKQRTPIKRNAIKRVYKPKKKVDGLDEWFDDKVNKLTGKCLFCGGKTCNDRRSVMHLLPKRENMFPSVATHPDNWIEGCFYGNSHHTNFDNNVFTLKEIKEEYPYAWGVIVDKFRRIYPAIADNEKYRVPNILLEALTE